MASALQACRERAASAAGGLAASNGVDPALYEEGEEMFWLDPEGNIRIPGFAKTAPTSGAASDACWVLGWMVVSCAACCAGQMIPSLNLQRVAHTLHSDIHPTAYHCAHKPPHALTHVQNLKPSMHTPVHVLTTLTQQNQTYTKRTTHAQTHAA